MSGPVDYITDVDYVTVDEEGPVAIHEGTGHRPHEATPGPALAPPVTRRPRVLQLPEPRRTKRLRPGEP